MITRGQLNADQRQSFAQMTMEAGLSESEALKLIDELCVQKGYTGLRVAGTFKLSAKGRDMARVLSQIEEGKN